MNPSPKSNRAQRPAWGPIWPQGCWPTPSQTLLLRACFLTNEQDAHAAWRTWRASNPLSFVDSASHQLLPFVQPRVQSWDATDPLLPHLRRARRYYWLKKKLLTRELSQGIQLLADREIPTLLLKGAALCATIYSDEQRPMSDLDVVVPRRQAASALDVLMAHGWKPCFPDPQRLIPYTHACQMKNAAGHELDLHFDFFRGRSLREEELQELWEAGRPVVVDQAATSVLCPTDQFLHTCEHGVRHSAQAPFRWLADAARQLQQQGDQIDGDRLRRLAIRHQLILPVQKTLQYLDQELQLAPPAEAASAMNGVRPSLLEKCEHALTTRRPRGTHVFWQYLPQALLRYYRLRKRDPRAKLGESLCMTHFIEPPLRRLAPELFKSAASDLRGELARIIRSLRIGRQSWQIPIARRQLDELEGFYPAEEFQGRGFRWSRPTAAVYLDVPPGDYEIRLQILPVRSGEEDVRRSLQATLNDAPLSSTGDSCADEICCQITRSMFVDHRLQRLAWRCDRWRLPADDDRELGVPLAQIKIKSRTPSAKAA